MNRRSAVLAVVAGLASNSALNLAFAQSQPATANSLWGAARNSYNDIDRFATTITIFASPDDASGEFDSLLSKVREGTLYGEENGARIVGDGSFFVRYKDPNFVLDEFVVRIGPLLYQFRSEATDYGGARSAYRLMEDVLARADTTAKTDQDVAALLPTPEEAAAYGLTEQLK